MHLHICLCSLELQVCFNPSIAMYCAPITQSSQLFYNHASHLIEKYDRESLQPQDPCLWFSQHWLNHARYGRRISGWPSLRVAIALYIAADGIRPSLAQSAACNEHHHLDLNSYLAATHPPTHPLAPKNIRKYQIHQFFFMCDVCVGFRGKLLIQ